jgi:hypothetical protein
LQATAEANNLAAVAAARETYTALMEEVCGGAKPYLSTAHLEAEHKTIKDKSLNQFINIRKMGGESFSESYKEMLEKVGLKYLVRRGGYDTLFPLQMNPNLQIQRGFRNAT